MSKPPINRNLNISIGKNITFLMQLRKYSPEKMVELLNNVLPKYEEVKNPVTVNKLYRWRVGRNKPRLSVLKALSEIFDTDIAYWEEAPKIKDIINIDVLDIDEVEKNINEFSKVFISQIKELNHILDENSNADVSKAIYLNKQGEKASLLEKLVVSEDTYTKMMKYLKSL